MQLERLYHSAVSTAEGSIDTERGSASLCSSLALLQNAFPQALETSAYSLRKRLICPRWWLTGVIGQWMSKDLELMTERLGIGEGDLIFSGPSLTAKNFPLVVSLWTELLAQVSNDADSAGYTVEVNLRRVLRGTASEIDEQREFLTQYLSAALKIQKVKWVQPRACRTRTRMSPSKAASLSAEPVGLMQIFENVLLSETDRQKLLITFAKNPRKLFSMDLTDLLPAQLHGLCHVAGARQSLPGLVTLQPDVLRAMSRSVSPKKLIPYLSLELTKSALTSDGTATSDGVAEGVWRGRSVVSRELPRLHKEELTQARALYDHGLLSWENEAPRQRIRNIKKETVGEGGSSSAIVHCWRLSQHVIDALSFEQAVTRHLSQDEVISARGLTGAASTLQLECDAPFSKPVGGERPSIDSVGATLERFVPETSRPPDDKPRKMTSSAVTTPKSASVTASLTRAQGTSLGTTSQKTIEVSLPEASKRQGQSNKRVVAFSSQKELQSKETWSDDEFLMCVAEFYESLTPMQQQAFEREMRRMSPEQFKVYVTPALKRFKFSNV